MSKPANGFGGWTNGQSPSTIEPSQSKKDSGWYGTEKPPYQTFNWLFYMSAIWIDWLFGLSVNQGTDDSSWVINAGEFFTGNDGINVNAINCNSMSIASSATNGSIKDSDSMNVESINNFEINGSRFISFGSAEKNNIYLQNAESLSIGSTTSISSISVRHSNSGSIDGNNIDIVNSSSFGVYANNVQLANCSSITVSLGADNVSLRNVDNFTETRPNTDTVKDFRVLGRHVHHATTSIAKNLQIYRIGVANQKMFGLGLRKYLSSLSGGSYYTYYAEGAGETWRDESSGLTSGLTISNGAQNTDGLFSNGVDSSDELKFPFDPAAFTVKEDHIVNFWVKVTGIPDSVNDANVAQFGAGSNYGWSLYQNASSSSERQGEFYILIRGASNTKVYLPQITKDIYHMITVVYDNSADTYYVYIDGEFAASRSGGGTQAPDGTTQLALKAGYIGAGTSSIDAKYADVSYIRGTQDPMTIKRFYCGGIELTTADRQKIKTYSEVKLLQNSASTIESNKPTYKGLLNDEFMAIQYDKSYKDARYTFQTNYINAFLYNHDIEL